MMPANIRHLLSCLCLAIGLLGGCSDETVTPKTDKPQLTKELIFYSWEEDLPQFVFDDFTAEYGVTVTFLTYHSTEEAVKNIEAGAIYDVAVIENDFIPDLVAKGLLAEIDHRNVVNFKHIAPAFRDLVFDPGNRYSVTFNWGLVGLLVRSDLAKQPISRWADLWDQNLAGNIHLWKNQRYLLAIALKSLGYSINSENPAELEAALQCLLASRSWARVSDYSPEAAEHVLAAGQTTVTYGWSVDVLRARASKLNIEYVLPAEGNIQWGDNFTIPASSTRKYTAEVFINFIMRPEINARIVNEQHYATVNISAYPFIKPELLNDPIIFPPVAEVKRAEVFQPLSPEGRRLYERIWAQFLAATADPAKGEP